MSFDLGSTVSNHDGTELQEVNPQTKDSDGDSDRLKVTERSILQAKLTKLAIQIGYAGKRKQTKKSNDTFFVFSITVLEKLVQLTPNRILETLGIHHCIQGAFYQSSFDRLFSFIRKIRRTICLHF